MKIKWDEPRKSETNKGELKSLLREGCLEKRIHGGADLKRYLAARSSAIP